MSTTAQLTSLLSNAALTRLGRMRVNSTRRFTNRSRGEHLSGKGGQSIEFADYRDYVAGDDIRSVDWNIFSRLHRPYVKLFRMEEDQHIVILVDASTSMMFENKLLRARQLAAAFAVMGLLGDERVSIYGANHTGEAPRRMPSRSGRANMRRAFDFLEAMESGGDLPVDQAVDAMLKLHRGRGVVVLLSDFFTYADLKRTFNLLYSAGLELFAVQVLAPSELDPAITGDVRLVDSETGQSLDVSSAAGLLNIYQEHRTAFTEQLDALARQRNGRFLCVDASADIEWVLFDLLRRKGWVA